MNQLVFIDNGKTVTDSLTIAEVFGKEHKRVMQDIRELECSEDFNRHNFVLTSYQDSMNREKPKYIVTEKGFILLVMGYTGKEAMRFKEMYIAEFEKMREQVQNRVPVLSPNEAMALALQKTAEMMTKVPVLENRIEKVERKVDEQITLEQGEQRRVQTAVATRIYDLEDSSEERSPLFRELYRELKNRWGVSSYRDLLRKDLGDVLAYINAWVPRKG